MIGMMRPFYQAHWDISKDIKHVWLLICTYYIAWILGGEGRGENGDCSRSVVRTVSTGCETPQCAASWMLLLYAGDSSRWLLTPSPQFLSRGGPDILAPGPGLQPLLVNLSLLDELFYSEYHPVESEVTSLKYLCCFSSEIIKIEQKAKAVFSQMLLKCFSSYKHLHVFPLEFQ